MTALLDLLWHGVRDALLMAWAVWWALVLGFAISAVVQAWVPRERIQRTLGGSGAGPTSRATLLGAASSSCSYAAVAIARWPFSSPPPTSCGSSGWSCGSSSDGSSPSPSTWVGW